MAFSYYDFAPVEYSEVGFVLDLFNSKCKAYTSTVGLRAFYMRPSRLSFSCTGNAGFVRYLCSKNSSLVVKLRKLKLIAYKHHFRSYFCNRRY